MHAVCLTLSDQLHSAQQLWPCWGQGHRQKACGAMEAQDYLRTPVTGRLPMGVSTLAVRVSPETVPL